MGIGECADEVDKPPGWSTGTILMICGTVAFTIATIAVTILIVKIIRRKRQHPTHMPLQNTLDYDSEEDGRPLTGF